VDEVLKTLQRFPARSIVLGSTPRQGAWTTGKQKINCVSRQEEWCPANTVRGGLQKDRVLSFERGTDSASRASKSVSGFRPARYGNGSACVPGD